MLSNQGLFTWIKLVPAHTVHINVKYQSSKIPDFQREYFELEGKALVFSKYFVKTKTKNKVTQDVIIPEKNKCAL